MSKLCKKVVKVKPEHQSRNNLPRYSEPIHLGITPRQKEEIEFIAFCMHISISEVVRNAIRRYVAVKGIELFADEKASWEEYKRDRRVRDADNNQRESSRDCECDGQLDSAV